MDDLNNLLTYLQGGFSNNHLAADSVRLSKPADLNSVTKDMMPDSNYSTSPQLYTATGTDVREHPMDLNAMGMVFDRAPNTVFLGQNGLSTNVLAHESSHVQQHRNTSINMDATLPGSLKQKVVSLLKSDDAGEFPSNAHYNMSELGAAFSGVEASMPKGHTIWNHPLVQDKFTPNEQKSIEPYMQSAYDKFKDPKDFVSIDHENPLKFIPRNAKEFSKSMDWLGVIQRNIRNWTAPK
jgi:hypothetical protein